MSDIKKINEKIYGSKDSWYSIKRGKHITKIPVFSNGGSTFNDGIASGQLKLNEKIDSSPCLFGINGDCDLICNNAVIWNDGEEIKRIKPTNECMSYIEKKMIEGFDFTYDFNNFND